MCFGWFRVVCSSHQPASRGNWFSCLFISKPQINLLEVQRGAATQSGGHGNYHQILILLKRGQFTAMGGQESRCWFSACTGKQKETLIDKHEGETIAFLKEVKDTTCPDGLEEIPADWMSPEFPPVSKPILDLAQKMSEDIITQALQLCWEMDIHYKDIPFVDIECEYMI